MAELGISVYPDKSDLDLDKQYLDKAHALGYGRVFMSLLQLAGDTGGLDKFKTTVAYANQLGMHVIVDINPELFKELDISINDLHFFHELGVWGLRLDEGFTGSEESKMTRNPYDLKIEINMSAGTNYLQSILSFHPRRENLLGCHNFYPQEYTGLGEANFVNYSRPYREANLHTAAFVSSQVGTSGPWPVSEGLPTIEDDRQRPIASQVQHLLMTGMVDDVIIGNAYASDAELKAAADSFKARQPQIKVDLIPDITDAERGIVLDGYEGEQLYRGDASDYLLRSTMTRISYAKTSIPSRNQTADFQRGDVLVVNDGYARYKGEMQIALTQFPNDGRRNVVGHIAASDMILLDLLKPWMSFKLYD
ncbi:MupG family TIM beta-alpha barrel fold protein [Lacticaseibacillus pabuli]|uniref:MupG family TIM beta-alpha barrel fold protein n=1 Tax=Lacticaseibacillus pabuli TaxID=3025672 RepID=A0ABY7WPI2_9LACO|nr:MupG family TIM beta-alpha barrel fold protein [Lacticaseibacillus sp. KACC 23028]WDF82098.1 MupG family TIM beta-alpha barrel fold protein [Lacticaseibacillus sp. KACC 23028]